MIWNKLATRIDEELAGHPRTFLRQYTISKTMHPDMRPLSLAYWTELQRKRYWQTQIFPAAIDSRVGHPFEFALDPRISPQSIQHGYYIQMLHDYLDLRIEEVGDIVEIGGGYGNFARIARAMGHRGRYQIVDLPEVRRLQQYFLQHAAPGHGVEFITAEEVGPADLLIATFSVSEMPMPLRDLLETKYRHCRSLFFGATQTFEGIDNVDYFTGLAGRIGGHCFKDQHRSAWFTVCRR